MENVNYTKGENMGANFDGRIYAVTTREELAERFRASQESSRYEDGHEYSGSIGMAQGLTILTGGRVGSVAADLVRRWRSDVVKLRRSDWASDKEEADAIERAAATFEHPDAAGVFPSRQAASAFLQEVAEKWGPAVAVLFRDGEEVRWYVGAWCAS